MGYAINLIIPSAADAPVSVCVGSVTVMTMSCLANIRDNWMLKSTLGAAM